jgi:biotin carboxyl carrier protein
MTFEIELDGRRCAVSVESAGRGRYRVVIDGQPHDVLAERIGDFGLAVVSAARDGGAAGPSREVYVAPAGGPGELLVSVRGRTVPVAVDGRTRRRRAADGGRHTDGEQAVSAPMPGRVVRVLVGPGDEVTARQGVVVVEAMKMENELRSPKAGRVRDVTVTPGMSVEAGRVLVVIE